MSDGDKGLAKSVGDIFTECVHARCAFHVAQNAGNKAKSQKFFSELTTCKHLGQLKVLEEEERC